MTEVETNTKSLCNFVISSIGVLLYKTQNAKKQNRKPTLYPVLIMAASIVLDDQRVSSLSESQDIILCVLMICSGVLSVFGSSTIIYRVLKNPTGTNSYNRIMLGLSFFDIISSISFILTPFLLPSETSHRVWAR